MSRVGRSTDGVYQRSTLGVLNSGLSICLCNLLGTQMFPKSVTVSVSGVTVPLGVDIGPVSTSSINFSSCSLNGGTSLCLKYVSGVPTGCQYIAQDPGSSYTINNPGPVTGNILQWVLNFGWISGTGAILGSLEISTYPTGSIVQPFVFGSTPLTTITCGGSATKNNDAQYQQPVGGAVHNFGGSATITGIKC